MSKNKHQVDPEHDVLKMFDELTFFERLQRTVHGLGQPKDTGDYKWAKLQVFRLWAPVLAFAIPASAVLVMYIMAQNAPDDNRMHEVTIEEAKPMDEKLEDIKPIEEEQPPEETQPMEELSENTVESTQQDFSPQPAPIDSVAESRSPVKLKGIVATRVGGARGDAMRKYGCPPQAEAAVIRSLRWLKKVQEPDGSWKYTSGGSPAQNESYQPAMTGLALLCFLGHGETPASEEYGQTVQKAITWLMKNQKKDGSFANAEGKNYSLAIATYALAEAYTMTQVPAVKRAAENSAKLMIKMQHAKGGWYWYSKADGKYFFDNKVKDADDTSLTGWCVQALKAAKIAGLKIDNLDGVLKKAGASLRANATSSGHFIYLSSGKNEPLGATKGLTAVGVLALQMLGQNKSAEVQRGLEYLSTKATCDWANPWGKPWSLYYWYYLTQANFHAGGDKWESWNKRFSVQIPQAQKPDGKDMGYWESIDQLESRLYATTMCTLMLEVYYRFLPSYAQGAAEDKPVDIKKKDDGIDIQIGPGV